MTQQKLPDAPRSDEEVIQLLTRLVKGLRFGTVELTVHEGTIVQIDRKEKYRFNNSHSNNGRRND